jgi:glycosyltransferase involved in cell wall biosynthesis
MKKLGKNNLIGDIEIQHEFTIDDLKDFFKSLSVLSVPVLKGEAFGLYQIEALASGVPLVQPDLGAFPEIINASGGGVIYSLNTAEALADKLKEVLSDPEKLHEMSITGRRSIEEKFNCRKLAEKMIEVYQMIRK